MENSSPFSVTHSDQFFHQSSGGAFHAPSGSSTSMLYTNRRPSGQDPHFVIGGGGAFHAPGGSCTNMFYTNRRPYGQDPHFIIVGGGHEDNNYNNLPDQPPSSTTFQPGQHVDPYGITSNQIYAEDSHLFDQNYVDFDATPQTQDINHSQALHHGEGAVATQTYSEAKQRRQYKRWTHEEMSKLLVAISESHQSRYLWTHVKNNHFSADIERSANSLKQKFKEMCKAAATSSGVKDPKTKELYYHALLLRGEIQQKKRFKKSFTGN